MLSTSTSPIPHIFISPASEKASPDPYSPFPSAEPGQDDSAYRPRFLSSQCHFLDKSPRYSSPLRPADCPPPSGLHRDQFDLLLQASRDRRAALSSRRKIPDLRKELAIKNQRNKQFERRALLLLKIEEPSLPTPKIPTDSPTVLHSPLPSLGLESPLALFDSLAKERDRLMEEGQHLWFEQADYRLPIGKPKMDRKLGRRKLPSLEEIIARHGPARLPPSMANDPILSILTAPTRPLALRSDKNASTTRSVSDTSNINIGRLHMPARRRPSSDSLSDLRLSATHSSPCCSNIEKTATAGVTRTRSNARYALTNPNVHALGRASTAREMITTIKRRTSPPPLARDPDTQYRSKRHSAPAEMQLSGRSGFEHPVLSLPGGF